jgi:hypothetical protein
MRANGRMTGMLGVYLTAAELTRLGFIVSPTSRSAFGADLLVTDQRCCKAWSVQVKTNRKAANFWLVNAHVADSFSESPVYVFVNIKGQNDRTISLFRAQKWLVFMGLIAVNRTPQNLTQHGIPFVG